MGINAYEARRGADLIVAAAGDPELRKKLLRLLDYWDPEVFAQLLEETRSRLPLRANDGETSESRKFSLTWA